MRETKHIQATSTSTATTPAQGTHGCQEHPEFPRTGSYPLATTVVEAGYPARETDGAEGCLASTMGFPVFIMLYFYAGN